MVCTVCCSVSTYFEIIPRKDEWFCPELKMDKFIQDACIYHLLETFCKSFRNMFKLMIGGKKDDNNICFFRIVNGIQGTFLNILTCYR
jgi:hypothetical protein